MDFRFGRFIGQPGNGALIIDLDYETGHKSWGCHEVDTIDKLKNYRFIGMPNSSELLSSKQTMKIKRTPLRTDLEK